ncbi:RNA polymerase sigma factor [Kribbella sp. NPDC000426]|uniref:RNA polymerase sigma factor n=1 Tax=Kribbella sp. NPDC000426 TaxID=3154255 RepID=UPI00332C02F7
MPAPTRLHVVSEDSYPDWEAVYNDNVDRVYRMMFAKVGNRPDAEDLTAEVFATALRPLQLSASVGEVRAYLFATARTVLAGYWRRTMGREITVLEEDRASTEPVTGADDDADDTDRTGAIARAEAILAELPERYRRILQLRFIGACSLKEAAIELGVSVGNAKVLQHRALRQAAAVADRMEG